MNTEDLHKGHRERLRKKFLASPELLSDHEVLEIILFSVFPRQDTNPLAHRLINTFGSLSAVLNADKDALTNVSGIGERAACEIKLFKDLVRRLGTITDMGEVFKYGTYKNRLIEKFKKYKDEVFLLYILDKRLRITFCKEFTSGRNDKVELNVKELAKTVALNPGEYAVICHNHKSGDLTPTKEDDDTTKKLSYLFGLHGCNLVDHIIVTDTDSFSYYHSGRLDEIKKSPTTF